MIQKRTTQILIVSLILIAISFLFNVLSNYMNINSILQVLTMDTIWRILLCLVIFFVVKKIEKRNIDSLDLYFRNIWKQIAIGIYLFSIFLIPLLVKIFIFHTVSGDLSMINPEELNMTTVVLQSFHDLIFVGFMEELIFRGYLLNRLLELSNSMVFAIALSSTLFGLVHYPANKDIDQVIFAMIMGLLFSMHKLIFKNCSLISFWIAHGLYDASFILLVYYTYTF